MADGAAMSPSAAGAVSIGNYKGVMLCNRPFNGVSSTLAKEARGPAAGSATKAAFLAGIPTEPLGMNVPILSEPAHAVHRDKKHTALSKHRRWLHDLQKERARLQEALAEDEELKQQRHERFAQREARLREAVRNNVGPEVDEDKLTRRPMWALTKAGAEAKRESMEDAEADELIEFANNLDLDQFMDDVEIKARVAQVEQQLAQVQALVASDEAEEKRAEREQQRLEDKAGGGLGLELLRRRVLDDDGDGGGDDDDDARSVASTVLSECKSMRSVHSVRSMAALARRAEAKLQQQDEPLQPRVVTIDEEQGIRMQIKTLPSNLPYIHRNPAI